MLNRFKIDYGTTNDKTYVWDKKEHKTIGEFQDRQDAKLFAEIKNQQNEELLETLKRLAMNAAYGLTPEQVVEWKIEEILERVEDEIRVSIDGFREQNQMAEEAAANFDWVGLHFELGAEQTETDF